MWGCSWEFLREEREYLCVDSMTAVTGISGSDKARLLLRHRAPVDSGKSIQRLAIRVLSLLEKLFFSQNLFAHPFGGWELV